MIPATHLEPLLDVLEQEIHLYRDLLEVLQAEKQHMIDLALDRLRETQQRKEALLQRARDLEEARIRLTRRIAHHLGRGEGMPLREIIAQAPLPWRAPLERCRSNLISLIHSIGEINQVNAVLVERSLSYTRDSLRFLAQLTRQLPAYLASGRLQEAVPAGQLVCRRG